VFFTAWKEIFIMAEHWNEKKLNLPEITLSEVSKMEERKLNIPEILEDERNRLHQMMIEDSKISAEMTLRWIERQIDLTQRLLSIQRKSWHRKKMCREIDELLAQKELTKKRIGELKDRLLEIDNNDTMS
jgi:hypothetical protein